MIKGYAELHCHSYFSLLDAASSPEALIAQAQRIGLKSIALMDHHSLAGAIRFWKHAKQAGVHPVIGAEVTLVDQQHLTLLAENQRGYANLCRLITLAHTHDTPADPAQWPGKGEPALDWNFLETHHAGLIALSGCRQGPLSATILNKQLEKAKDVAGRLTEIFGRGNFWIELQHHYLPDDDRLVRDSLALARSLNLNYVATNDVHYATRPESRFRDALVAIRHNQSLTETRKAGQLALNSNYYLAAPDEMLQRFAELPDAVSNSLEIAERCSVSLDFSNQRLPAFPAPEGKSEFQYLYDLCHAGLGRRYPRLKPEVLKQLTHELAVIEHAGLAGYFLIVWDIINFARGKGIRCQGRGSAANSIVAYLLGITSVDPLEHNLLFERFLSEDRYTTPDVDIDFAADRREEVIQYVYERYGASHTAMVCNVVTYQARSAVRDLSKALGFSPSEIDRLAKSLDTHSCHHAAEELLKQIEEDDPQHPLRMLADLLRLAQDVPRHLGIHVGGMLVTALALDEVVPLERATMPGRVVCQWDKLSVEDAALVKIDVLGLRTLALISDALAHIENPPDLDSLTLDDPKIFAML